MTRLEQGPDLAVVDARVGGMVDDRAHHHPHPGHSASTCGPAGTMPRVSSSRRAAPRQLGRLVVPVGLQQDDQVGVGQGGVQVVGAGDGLPVDLPVRHVRVVVADHGAAGQQLAGQRPGRRFPLVGDVTLVGHPEQQDLGPVDRLGVPVEQLGGAVGDVAGHPAVDLLGQLDEPERVAQRADLVGQVVGVDGDAVPADARAGVERLEPERLGGRAADRVPQVHVQLAAEDGHLVDQGDVHVPVGVLQQLGHLRLAGGLGPDHLVADLARRTPRPRRCRTGSGRRRSWACWRSRTPGCPGRSAPARRPGRSRSRRSARTPSPAAGGRSPRWCPDRWWTPATPACPPSPAGPRSPSRPAPRTGPARRPPTAASARRSR